MSNCSSEAIATGDSKYNSKRDSSPPSDLQLCALEERKLHERVIPKSGSGDNGWYPTLSNSANQGDFVIYRGGDVNVVFGESVPRNVSEACLVNDHYILVKMPDASVRKKAPPSVVAREDSNTIRGEPILEQQVYKGTATVVKYLKPNRLNRKIAPIQNESTESSVIVDAARPNETSQKPSSLRNKAKRLIRSCWAGDDKVEVFTTKTQLEGKFLNSLLEPHTREDVEQAVALDLSLPKFPLKSDGEAVSTSSIGESTHTLQVSPSVSNLREHFKAKNDGKIEVILEPRGHLVTNESETNVFLSSLRKTKTGTSRKVKLGRTFYWLRPPFLDRSKTKKTTKKIHAIVHKTYFLRWSKPPETKWHGYGVERSADDGVPMMMRRCRSALF